MGLRCDSLNSQSLKVFCSSVCVAEADGVGLAGAIVKMARDGLGAAAEQPGPHGATVYYIVESLEMTEKRVNELGGSVIQAKTTESAHGSLMKFSDPEGKQFGCYEVVRR